MTSKGPKTTLRCPQKDLERTSGGGPVSNPRGSPAAGPKDP